MFEIRNQDHLLNGIDDKDFLVKMGGYVIDKRNGTEGLTMAGLLLFGKGQPIRNYFDNLTMDYLDYTNLIGEDRYSDRLTYDLS